VLDQRTLHVDAQVTGRLAPGVSRAQGEAQLSALAATFATTYPDDAAQWTRVSLTALRDSLLGDAASRLRVLALIVALVLAITALNAAGLLVARHAARARTGGAHRVRRTARAAGSAAGGRECRAGGGRRRRRAHPVDLRARGSSPLGVVCLSAVG
jgi:hypothetical protein